MIQISNYILEKIFDTFKNNIEFRWPNGITDKHQYQEMEYLCEQLQNILLQMLQNEQIMKKKELKK